MFYSTGILIYSNNPYKLIVTVDQEISDYYRSLIPKTFYVRKQLYPAHISVVRNEIPVNIEKWACHHNVIIDFEYEPVIYNDECYYWINAYSSVLEYIRVELGLYPTSEFTKSPDGKHKFHITIGNIKHLLKSKNSTL